MFCKVVFDVPLDRDFDYAVPEALRAQVKPGIRITAPFGPMLTTGLVTATAQHSSLPPGKIKEIACVLDEKPVFGSDLFALARFMKQTWGGPIGQILFSLVPAQAYFKLSPSIPLPATPFSAPSFSFAPSRQAAWEQAEKQLGRGFKQIVFCGPDAEGQTQSVLRLAANVLSQCGQALITLPDVLAAQNLAAQLESSFGKEWVCCWHSKMLISQKKKIFSRVSAGHPLLVISARSGGLLPFKNLQLAAMLEEENDNYKQEENKPYFHLRDLLAFRCQQHEALFICASDTPSLETLRLVQEGKCGSVHFPLSSGQTQLKVTAKKGEHSPLLSDFLLQQLKDTRQAGQASVIILNRRGYSNAYYCLNCGAYAKCKKCGAILAREKNEKAEDILICKKCGHKEPLEQTCPLCQNKIFKSRGGGTQKIVSELNNLFPGWRVLRLDSDTLKNKDGQGRAVRRALDAAQADVVVGTRQALEAALSPRVTLCAVADADLELDSPDFRASEKFGQLLFKLKNRLAGRPNGRLVIQSSCADIYPFEALKTAYEDAASEELLARESFGYPPYVSLVKVLVRSKDPVLLSAETARIVSAAAPFCQSTLGPTRTGKKTDVYQKQYILLKAAPGRYAELVHALDTLPAVKRAEFKLIADPYDFY